MKKSLLKKITRMARDGDPDAIEALAEAVEEITETPSEETVVIAAAAEPEATPAAPAAPVPEAVVIETPAEGETAADEGADFSEILARLDQIISLLTPAAEDEDPAEDPVEEIAAAVEEALEAAVEAETPADPVLAEAAEEVAEEVVIAAEESGTIGEGDECEKPDSHLVGDVIRSVMGAMRPHMPRMTHAERKKVGTDIAANLGHSGKGRRSYFALVAPKRRAGDVSADLGRKIMASRNANFRK